MYRCIGCDAPAQANCDCSKEKPQQNDPWGWKEEERKLDINSGRYVEMNETETTPA